MPKPDLLLPRAPFTYILDSDSMYRPDVNCLADGRIEDAEMQKHKLEEQQRKDKQFRV